MSAIGPKLLNHMRFLWTSLQQSHHVAETVIVSFSVNRKIGLNNGITSSTHSEDAA